VGTHNKEKNKTQKKSTALDIKEALVRLANKKRALVSQNFFKTGKGEYGAGDTFLGITVPTQRKIAQTFYKTTPLTEILIMQYEQAAKNNNFLEAKKIYTFYLKNTKHINNWDLVDTSASYIVGSYLFSYDKNNAEKLLSTLALRKNIWERRIAIISTHFFIKNNKLDTALFVAKKLLHDPHDLIHKAVGWTLREVGKKSETILTHFLSIHYSTMPRTALRYSIERFPKTIQKKYLAGTL
jgi:3-methyladenine DNA glycosylase AlkD